MPECMHACILAVNKRCNHVGMIICLPSVLHARDASLQISVHPWDYAGNSKLNSKKEKT